MTIWIARLLSTVLVFAFLAGCKKQQSQEPPDKGASAATPASVASPAVPAALPPLPASAAAPESASAAQPQAPAQVPQYPPEELEALVAPIALYPDSLLSQVLMASTYPLEVVHAARWVKEHRDVKGDAAVKAVQDQPWDVSVKSLVAFPQVLQPMNDKLDWTQRLGDAFLAQPKDVLAAVQRLRVRAQQAGNLNSNPQQKVIVEAPPAGGQGNQPAQGGQAVQAPQTIVRIEPADPQVIYVPSYNPTVVYGGWSAPAYPPTYWPPYPAYYPGAALASGFAWGLGIAAAGAIFGGCNWNSGDVNINVNKATNIDRNFNRANVKGGTWQHDARHRQGVAYRDNATRDKYSRGVQGADARREYRGRTGGAGERANAANRAAAGNPSAANRAARANNANVGNRAGAGNRAATADRGAAAGNRAQTANRSGEAGNRAQAPNRNAEAGNRAQTANRNAEAGNRAQTANRAQAANRGAGPSAQPAYGGGGYSGGGRDTAFQGVGGGGAAQRDFSRGQASVQSSNFGRAGGGGGGARGGGGGARGGGRR
ncbi:hypothetical protein AWB79_05286 [Caballeronia hypogeia]|uniref:Lipoprotein n=1 Tax=Caballeronia hypogeia TaxID=1777140 RepID=A0A158CFM9_9BURK|nr:DUF3300 domain-containing protein [Caballeronia hypogeia]SAK81144.1 hypothetical protein AWB79_05286 [Caballeronia hypogeia]